MESFDRTVISEGGAVFTSVFHVPGLTFSRPHARAVQQPRTNGSIVGVVIVVVLTLTYVLLCPVVLTGLPCCGPEQELELQMKARQAQAYEAMKGQFEGLLGRLQVSELLAVEPSSFSVSGRVFLPCRVDEREPVRGLRLNTTPCFFPPRSLPEIVRSRLAAVTQQVCMPKRRARCSGR